MADIAALKSEIDADPLARGYSGMDDAAVAVDINTVYRSRFTSISSAELLAWVAAEGRMAKIKAAQVLGVDDTIKSISEAAYLMVTRDGTTLDLSLPDRMELVDALVAYRVLSSADKTSLERLGTETVSRATELGLGLVRTSDVQQARAL